MTPLLRRLAAIIVLGSSLLLAPDPAGAAGAAAADPPCAAETAAHDQTAAARDTARQAVQDHATTVYQPAVDARREAVRARKSWEPLVPPARAAFRAARDAYRADRTPERRQALDDARAEFDLALSNVAVTSQLAVEAAQAVAAAAAERAELRARLDDAQAPNIATRQALDSCLAAHPVTGTVGAVTVFHFQEFTAQAGDLTFGPLYSRAGSTPTYRVVPVTTCGEGAALGCSLGSAPAGPDGVLRFTNNPLAHCGLSSETFDIYREGTGALVASVPLSWTAVC